MKLSKNGITHQLLRYTLVYLFAFTPGVLLAQRDYYTPKALLIPLHDQKNQLHVSLGRGGGYDLNLCYSLTEHFAVFSTANLDYTVHRRVTILGSRFNILKDDHVVKAGIGYFSKIDKPLASVIEAYLGVGTSKIDNYWYFKGYTDGEFTKARYRSFFGQFNAGKKMRLGEIALGIRVAYSKYSDFVYYSDHPNTYYITYRYVDLEGVSVDPVVSYSCYIWKGLKLNAQAGVAIPLYSPPASFITTHTTNDGVTVLVHEESPGLSSLIGRLSVQYNFDFGKKSNTQKSAY